MSESSGCPEWAELEAREDADPGTDADDAIDRHLAACPGCRERVAELGENLQLAMRLRESRREPVVAGMPHVLGRYRLRREVGRGGMGVVYLAEDPKLRRDVAIKVLPSGPQALARAPDRLHRFEREAQALAALNHPGIATVYSLEEADGLHFITMEFVPGRTLAQLLLEGPLPLESALAIGRRVAAALEAAHERGVVHRDLKPHNVVVSPDAGAKVLDFGLAKIYGSNPALDAGNEDPAEPGGGFLGTPGYMSPEQVQGGDADHRADVWAFGCVLYECLSGRRVIPGNTAAERMAATGNLSPDLDCLPPRIPETVRALLRQCLAPDRERRLGSMRHARRTLDHAVSRPEPDPDHGPAISLIPNNLPHQLSRFVGRERDTMAVVEGLAKHRLITLTGVGGCGKSRLAVETATSVLERFPDGAWMLQLAALTADNQIVPALASILGHKEMPGESLLGTLTKRLETCRVLILFDNCEHLLSGCASLAGDLLRSCTRVRILCTSREGLGLPGEVIQPVPSLPVPPEPESRVQVIRGLDSVRLFEDRAALVRPGFRVDEENAGAVARICRSLDGIPLALELAAARVRHLPVDGIARRLDDRFRLLSGGTRAALPRHRTLKAAVDWSHDQLDARERALFRRLAGFSGGWTLEAAETVCGWDPLPVWELLDLLSNLVDKCLVEVDIDSARSTGEARYRFLETMRQYATDRLMEAGETVEVARRHREHFAQLAENAVDGLTGPEKGRWMRLLRADHDNFIRAIESGLEGDCDLAVALQITGGLGRYWDAAGFWSPGLGLLERVLAAPGEPSRHRVRALNWAGNLAMYLGDLDRAEQIHQENLPLCRVIRDRWYEASAYNNLGSIASYRGAFDTALAHHQQALHIRRSLDDSWATALSLLHLGMVNARREDYAGARGPLAEAAERFQALGEVSSLAIVRVGQSLEHRASGARAEARALLQECTAFCRGAADSYGEALAAVHRARVELDDGDRDAARYWSGAALRLHRSHHDRTGMSQCLVILAGLEAHGGDAVRAARLLGAAERLRGRTSVIPPPLDQRDLDATVSRVRARLEDRDYERAWEEGRAMSEDRATALALGDSGSTPDPTPATPSP